MTTKEKTLSVWRKIGYGMGEAGSQFSWTLISSYLTVYYTDAVGLAPAVITIIMMAARIWDAIDDPMFGAVAENTHTRWGRYRPYILFGAPVLALLNCLTFLNLDIPDLGKAIWCGLTYILCGAAYSAVNLSVGCLANSMTPYNRERVSLNAFRGLLSGVVQMLVSAVTMPLILYFGGQSTSSDAGYFVAAVLFSAACLPCFWICFASSKEVIGPKREQRRGNTLLALIRSFRYAFSDRNARLLILAMLVFLIGIFGRLGIMAYYFIYILEKPGLMAGFSTIMSLGMFLVNVYAPVLLNKFDKKWVGVGSALAQALCCTAFFFAGEYRLNSVILIVGFFYGATNLAAIVSNTMGAEIVDDNWLKTGIRSDGVIYSSISFATKLGNAIGGSVGILVLAQVGFKANADLSNTVLTNMNAVINFGPAVFFLIAGVLFSLNGMTNKIGRENEKKLCEQQNSKGMKIPAGLK